MSELHLTFHILSHYEYAYLLFTDEVPLDAPSLVAYRDSILYNSMRCIWGISNLFANWEIMNQTIKV